jgi:hypothetical protein
MLLSNLKEWDVSLSSINQTRTGGTRVKQREENNGHQEN